MPKINFAAIKEPHGALPEGEYHCKVEKINERTSKKGDEMWGVAYQVKSGKFTGRMVWNNLVFSEAAMLRVKFFCDAVGLGLEGEAELSPAMVIGKELVLKVLFDEKEKRNRIPFEGFAKMEEETEK